MKTVKANHLKIFNHRCPNPMNFLLGSFTLLLNYKFSSRSRWFSPLSLTSFFSCIPLLKKINAHIYWSMWKKRSITKHSKKNHFTCSFANRIITLFGTWQRSNRNHQVLYSSFQLVQEQNPYWRNKRYPPWQNLQPLITLDENLVRQNHLMRCDTHGVWPE